MSSTCSGSIASTTKRFRFPSLLSAKHPAIFDSKGNSIRLALLEKLDDLEDLYVAEQRLEQPEEPYWTLEQLERGNDLESDH